MRLQYFGVRVTDLERSVKFYTEKMGLKEIKRGEGTVGGAAGTWVLLRDSESRQKLELNWYPDDNQYAVPFVPGEGLDHLGFFVDNVKFTFNELVSKGVKPILPPSATDGHVAYLEDPDGNWIELFEKS